MFLSMKGVYHTILWHKYWNNIMNNINYDGCESFIYNRYIKYLKKVKNNYNYYDKILNIIPLFL
jgi:hypothetical protein